jgi:hypothetical protein
VTSTCSPPDPEDGSVGKSKDIRPSWAHPARQTRKLQQQRSDGAKRIVSETVYRDHNRLSADDRRQLRRHVQHLVVVCDQPVPAKMVQRQEQGPVVQLQEPWINALQALHLDVSRQIASDSSDQ